MKLVVTNASVQKERVETPILLDVKEHHQELNAQETKSAQDCYLAKHQSVSTHAPPSHVEKTLFVFQKIMPHGAAAKLDIRKTLKENVHQCAMVLFAA